MDGPAGCAGGRSSSNRRGGVMAGNVQIEIPQEGIADFCRQNHIRKLALFGSVLRGDFRPGSDVDALVEFEPGAKVGLITFAGIGRYPGPMA